MSGVSGLKSWQVQFCFWGEKAWGSRADEKHFTSLKWSLRACGSGGEQSWLFWPGKYLPICSLSEHVRSASGSVPQSCGSEGSCARLQDNSRTVPTAASEPDAALHMCSNYMAFFPVTKEFRNFAWFPCQKCVADIMGVGRSHGITKH